MSIVSKIGRSAFMPEAGLPIEDSFGQYPVEAFDDFLVGGYNPNVTTGGKFSETADLAAWDVNVVDGGTDEGEAIVVGDAHGGVLEITTNDADADAVGIQLNGNSFYPAANRIVAFAARIALTATTTPTTTIDWWAGLAAHATANVATLVTNGFGFGGHSGTAADGPEDAAGPSIYGYAINGAITSWGASDHLWALTDTAVDYADDTFIRLAAIAFGTKHSKFYVNGTYAFKIDGDSTAADTTSTFPGVPTAGLTPTFWVAANGAEAKTMKIDYVHALAAR
jgi:hypothetical protein